MIINPNIVRSSRLIFNFNLFSVNTHNVSSELQKRFLFHENILRIMSFKESRDNISNTIIPSAEAFKQRMNEKCAEESLIFTDDLRKMLKIAETSEDISLLHNMLKKFDSQQNVIRFGTYTIGPEIMRMFYVLDMPEEAIKMLKDPVTTTTFNQYMSILILYDLLLKKEMYEEAVGLINIILEKEFKNDILPYNIAIAFFASCYKWNTAEGFAKASEVWNTLLKKGYKMPMRAIGFYSVLALNQNEPELCLKCISLIQNETTLGINIKALSLCKLLKYEEIINLFASFMSQVHLKKIELSLEVIKYVEDGFKDAEEEMAKQLSKLINDIKNFEHVTKKSLDALLCQKIQSKQYLKNNKK